MKTLIPFISSTKQGQKGVSTGSSRSSITIPLTFSHYMENYLKKHTSMIKELDLISLVEELEELIDWASSFFNDSILLQFWTDLVSVSEKTQLPELKFSEAMGIVREVIDNAVKELGIESSVDEVLPLWLNRSRDITGFRVYDARFEDLVPIEKSSAGASVATVVYASVIALTYSLMGKRVVYLVEDVEENAHPIAQYILGVLLQRISSRGVTVIACTHSEYVLAGILDDKTKVYVTKLEKKDKTYKITAKPWKPGVYIPGFFSDSASIIHKLGLKIADIISKTIETNTS